MMAGSDDRSSHDGPARPASGFADAGDSANYGAEPGPLVSAKWIVVALAIVAIVGAAASWFYYAGVQRRPLALWGSERAPLLLRAPVAIAHQLAPADDPPPTAGETAPGDSNEPFAFERGGRRWRAVASRDVSRTPGFSHVRQSLIHDAAFDWDEPPGVGEPAWSYALEFVDGDRRLAVLFDFDNARAAPLGEARSASIRPAAGAIRGFLEEQFQQAAPR